MQRRQLDIACIVVTACAAMSSAADAPVKLPEEVLAIQPVSRYGRAPVPIDAVQALIASGKWEAPSEGETLPGLDGQPRRWMKLPVKNGTIEHAALNGGYVYFRLISDSNQVVLLEAAGSVATLVNGEPRAGDMYRHGYVTLPISLRKGNNDLLFQVGRGSLSLKLHAPKARQQFHLADTTVPDLTVGQVVDTEAAVVLLNATPEPTTGLAIEATLPGADPVHTLLPGILPTSVRKVGFRLRAPKPVAAGKVNVALRLLKKSGDDWLEIDSATLALDIKKPDSTLRRTFRSDIDGSVQYYALVPARPDGDRRPGLVLTLHGASVEAIGQAASYAPKTGLHIVAPTNRRPYGFDWEDWGRWDALEVLERVQTALGTDPARTYLTGHSMGGHGTWHVGATFPDRFAAIGPSAGWVSMWSYAGVKKAASIGQVDELIVRAANPSDTLGLCRNYNAQGVYILHGDADDNVPVGQARLMRKTLADFHADFVYYEERGAGHWWGKPGMSGAACVDWPAMFQFFDAHRIPERQAVREVSFTTASPGVSADCHWARIEAQVKTLVLSSVTLRRDPTKRSFTGVTDNVRRLSLDLVGMMAGPLTVQLDGQAIDGIAWPGDRARLVLTNSEGKWSVTGDIAVNDKNPARYGPFREAFRRNVLFVYGTAGTPDENAWALAKAKFDAEQFWYRGNGSIDVIPDTAFDPTKEPERNVMLYGHADSNSAWARLLETSPIQVERGSIRAGHRTENSEALAALFVRPRPGSAAALVGVVAGTGLAGMRTADRIPYFTSGVGLPDWIILASESLKTGLAGVRGAGYFGGDWSLEQGESAWRK